MLLRIAHPDAVRDPYRIERPGDLDAAIAHEADTVAADADSSVLDDPSDTAREQLRQRVIADATRALRRPGDTFTDPSGIRWTLEEAQVPAGVEPACTCLYHLDRGATVTRDPACPVHPDGDG